MLPQHEIGGEVTVPVADYWIDQGQYLLGHPANTWLQVGGGVDYDDGYLVIGAQVTRTGPTPTPRPTIRG